MIHIVPTADIKEHDLNTFCPCDPLVDYDEPEILVIHNAFDGRELLELAEEILHGGKNVI